MLFILTGDIQIGKTRWLTSLCEGLTTQGVPCYGVLSPGIWRKHCEERKGHAAQGTARDTAQGIGQPQNAALHYEKLGIELVLLPSRERLPFAWRRDLIPASDQADETQQADTAQLGWALRDDAIILVNEYFDQLEEMLKARAQKPGQAQDHGQVQAQAQAGLGAAPGLLLVDELGRLELLHEGGFTSAVRLLGAGPTLMWPHAIVIVRDRLASRAVERFTPAWGEVRLIAPDSAARAILEALYAQSSRNHLPA